MRRMFLVEYRYWDRHGIAYHAESILSSTEDLRSRNRWRAMEQSINEQKRVLDTHISRVEDCTDKWLASESAASAICKRMMEAT